jgi:hypothetical protein
MNPLLEELEPAEDPFGVSGAEPWQAAVTQQLKPYQQEIGSAVLGLVPGMESGRHLEKAVARGSEGDFGGVLKEGGLSVARGALDLAPPLRGAGLLATGLKRGATELGGAAWEAMRRRGLTQRDDEALRRMYGLGMNIPSGVFQGP